MVGPFWQWGESVQRGTDYASQAVVRAYDKHMGALRDLSAEAQHILEFLGLSPDDVVLEIGTGTGSFARAAARVCREVIALDVSGAMLTYAEERAREEGIENIAFRQAGFLTYEHEGEPFAGAVSQLALHHLPDAWKFVALRRLDEFIRPRRCDFASSIRGSCLRVGPRTKSPVNKDLTWGRLYSGAEELIGLIATQ